ncbi:MAG TPA: amidase family protein, partial [Acidimicrobiales bacterium]|nr:amidase family protein [Acidimicrobiales bacterium]
GMTLVDAKCDIPPGGREWAMSNMESLLADLGDKYPECESLMTPEMMFGLNIAYNHYDLATAAVVESHRRRLIESMADLFDQADLIIAATNPDVAFNAAGPLPTTVEGRDLPSEVGFERALMNNGSLTIPSNLCGNPAMSLPIGLLDGLPVGMQVIAAHHRDALLLDVGLAFERSHPWPKVAPSAPC